MFKKIVVLFLVLAMVSPGTIALAATSEDSQESENRSVLNLSENDSLFVDFVEQEDIDKFNETNVEQYVEYDLIIADSNAFEKVEVDKVIELIDNGATLYIEDSNVSLNRVSSMLEIDRLNNMSVDGAYVTGAFIFNHNNSYCMGFVGVVECTYVEDVDSENVLGKNSTFNKPIPVVKNADGNETTLLENIENIKMDTMNFIESVDEFRDDFDEHASEEMAENVVYMQLPEKGFNGVPAYGYFSLVGDEEVEEGIITDSFAIITISQYRYEICAYAHGSNNVSITDIITNFAITPKSTLYVGYYATEIGPPNSSYTNYEIIDQSEIDSSAIASYTFGDDFPIDPSVMITGNYNKTTTNEYNTINQSISNDINGNMKMWTGIPQVEATGKKWEIEPGIRMRNNNISYATHATSHIYDGFVFIGGCNMGYYIPYFGVSDYWSSSYLLGDINFDGYVTNMDLVMLSRALLDMITLTADQHLVADMNHDGNVTNADQVILARFILSQ